MQRYEDYLNYANFADIFADSFCVTHKKEVDFDIGKIEEQVKFKITGYIL